jgi:hypothetical protein
VIETRERKAHDVEVATFDAGNEPAGVALNGIGARFVVRFAGGEVAEDLVAGQRGEMDERGFDESTALGVGKADEGYAGDDGVGAAGKLFEHVTRIIRGAGLAENETVERNDSVRGDDDRRTDSARGNEFGFCFGEPLNVFVGGFTGERGFVHRGREHNKREASIAKDFGAACGGGSKNQLHGCEVAARILQSERGDSLCFGPGEEMSYPDTTRVPEDA